MTSQATIPKGDVVDIGKIPRGKKYLSVFLNAEVDVDIQLFDAEDATTFPEGTALIAYCEEDGCNKGILGNNDGTAESTTYNGASLSLWLGSFLFCNVACTVPFLLFLLLVANHASIQVSFLSPSSSDPPPSSFAWQPNNNQSCSTTTLATTAPMVRKGTSTSNFGAPLTARYGTIVTMTHHYDSSL